MAFSDLYQILDNQDVGGQRILNVYQVTKLNPAFDSADVLLAYLDTVYDDVRAIQPDTLTHGVVEVASLSDPLDFATGTRTPDIGLLAGNPLASFVAATIQFNRLRTDIKNGQKRWVAGNEGTVTGNFWTAAFNTLLATLGTTLISQWEDAASPGIPVCSLIILKRFCTTSPSPPCVGGYRLPENDAEAAISYIPTSFSARDTVRSQTSRKRLV